MKPYWSIPGPSGAPLGVPCLGFRKYDGSQMRFEWSKKRGWYKSGSRTVLIDDRNSDFGDAVPLFEKTYAEGLEKTLRDTKDFRGIEGAVAYCEYFGPRSFAGLHFPDDPKQLVLFDVNIHKKGMVLPREFLKIFGHLGVAELVYEGNFNKELIEHVKTGCIPGPKCEGIVAKGIMPGRKRDQHALWMAKIKSQWWMQEVRVRALGNPLLARVLADNEREQT